MNKQTSVKDVLQYLLKHSLILKWYIITSTLWAIIVTAAALIAPIFFKNIIDIISKNLDKNIAFLEIKEIFIYFVIIQIIIFITWRIIDYVLQIWRVKVDINISLECFEYIHKHSHNFFINSFAWSWNKKVSRLVWAIQWLLDIFIRDITRFIFSYIFIVIVLYKQNIYLWIWVLVWIWTFIIISYFLSNIRIPYVKEASIEWTKQWWIYADTIINNYNISIFGSLKKEYQIIKDWLKKWEKLEKKSTYVYIFTFIFLSWMAILWEIALLYFSIKFWFLWYISVWTFVLILSYQMILSQQIFALAFMFWKISSHIWNALDMLEVLNTPHEIIDKKDAKELKVTSWKIEFKNVKFLYSWEKVVFENLNLIIKPWEKVAIVWSSWSWKSTFIKLLFRFYDLNSWSIEIDGQDIKEVTQDSLRKSIWIVPQEPLLFHRTLRENICYAKDEVSQEELEIAAKKSHCLEFISKLNDGFDTFVWERWVKLSGWERQRVAIARALIANNKILILDEATSALDSESEKFIQDAFDEVMKEKTMIVIAHRLSTIMKMDRIIVLENWKIIQDWSHKELLEKGWVYKKLWDIQSGGFIND